LENWPRASLYPLAGAVCALGAPLGLIFLRCALSRDFSISRVVSLVETDAVTYVYTTASTLVAFAVFGAVLGRTADRLRNSSETDLLTGLYNRRYVQRHLGMELRRSARYGLPLSFLLIDVDGLKRLNDVDGHEAGDAALCSVARALKQSCRITDVPGRWGGDEFVVLAPGISGAGAIPLAERIREALRRESGGHVSVSIGVADLSSAGGVDGERLYAAADEALYEAKRGGRDRASLSAPAP
jgi:diguanylate cyclase (GGDEF)-like protein